MSVEDLRTRIRPELARSSPYRWQEGIPDGPVDRFDMNTPADAPAWYAEAIARLAAIPPNDYPDASYLPLKRAIAGYAGVDAGQVVVGAGCDEMLALCAQLALGRGDTALVAKPTYQLYAVASRNAGAEVLALEPGAGLALAREELVRAGRRRAPRLAVQPEQPDRRGARRGARRAHLRGLPGHRRARPGLPRARRRGLLAARSQGTPNLVVTRTFSKGFALGAARVGYGLAQPALAEALDALRPPGSISSWSAAVAELACRETDEMRGALRRASSRSAAGWPRACARAGVEVLAQAGNFVLARVAGARRLHAPRRARAASCARSRTSRCWPTASASPSRTAPANDRLLRALAELAGGEAPAADDGVRGDRIGEVRRATRETRIEVRLGLLGGGRARVATGLGFLDHMLTSLAFWSLTDLELRCSRRPLGRRAPHRRGLRDRARRGARPRARRPRGRAPLRLGARAARRGARRGHRRPLGPRHRRARPRARRTGDRPPADVARPPLLRHASRAAAGSACTSARRGEDDHHVAEAAFKAIALALREAVEPDPARSGIASTKGVL